MATLTKGILSFNLDWQFVIVGVFIAITMELSGVKALAFAIGLYLPLATTLPIFLGGVIKAYVDWRAERRNEIVEDGDLSRGNLFATGLIAGGAVTGVVVAVLQIYFEDLLVSMSAEHALTERIGATIYECVGSLFFAIMGFMLYRLAVKK
jgi:uncharacterized oligopeptide transporter (OPT) family protein